MNLNILKGLLIILVIADHNEYTRALFPEFFRGLTFHVVGFMAIPFLKAPGKLGSPEFAAYAFRLYYPFFLVACALWLALTVAGGAPLLERLGMLSIALYSGNADILKSAAGMGLLWFLPSFISVVAIRNFIDSRGGTGKSAAFIALAAVHAVIGTVASAIQDFLPMGLLPALYIVPLAYIAVALHRLVFEKLPAPAAVLAGLAAYAAVKALQMHLQLANEVGFSQVADYSEPLALLVNDLEAVAGTLMLFQVSRLKLLEFTQLCGKYSMQIYLFHAFVALGVYKLLSRLVGAGPAGPLFITSMLATILLTLTLAHLIMKNSNFRRLVFPRSPADLGLKA